jgi:Na+(H+)/acetate symporter ActP
MSIGLWTVVFVGGSFALYLAIAWWARVRDTKGFYVAGRGVPASANGMATAADWMSAASFISMAGLISTMGYAGGVYLMGWTGGYVLLALMLAPYLRKFGHFTVPDFVGDRYDSNVARLVAVICALFISFTYVAGQMRGVGVVFSRFIEVDINTGVIIGMAIGMRILVKIWKVLAPNDRASAILARSTRRKPVAALIITMGPEASATAMMRGSLPKPKRRIRSGTSASMGVVTSSRI